MDDSLNVIMNYNKKHVCLNSNTDITFHGPNCSIPRSLPVVIWGFRSRRPDPRNSTGLPSRSNRRAGTAAKKANLAAVLPVTVGNLPCHH